jgi:Metal-dependent hydrolase
MKTIVKILRISWRVITCIALVILLLSAFSHWVSPYRSVWFSYLGLFFPFILLGNLIILIINLVFAQWKQSIATGIVLLLCSGSIFTYFSFNGKTKNLPDDCIKVLTYNVWRFQYLLPHGGEKVNEVLQYIADCDADIICLQEFGATSDKGLLSMSTIKEALSSTPYYYVENSSTHKTLTFGIAVFSKYPIVKAEKIIHKSEYNGSLLVELDVNGRRVTVINNHLESNRLSMDERAEYDGLARDPNMTELRSFTQTMYKRLTPAFKARALQAQRIREAIDEADTPYILVCGDFNDTPISYARHKIKGNLKDAFNESGRGMGITYNKYNFLFRIDYILYSKNMKSYNTEVGKLKNSDHYPVSTYIQFKD